MKNKHLLAINTANGSCNVAVSYGREVVNIETSNVEKGHSEIILPLIDKSLKNSNVTVQQLDGFLVCTGPGNYTSLRVALSATRGLSMACGRQACGISLFELLSTNERNVLVLIEAPMEKVYAQNFSDGVQVDKPKLTTLEELKGTKKYYGAQIIGYRARELSTTLKSRNYFESTEINFTKFVQLGLNKLKANCPRPKVLYIK